MAIVIRRLEEHDEVENFDCGDDALNGGRFESPAVTFRPGVQSAIPFSSAVALRTAQVSRPGIANEVPLRCFACTYRTKHFPLSNIS